MKKYDFISKYISNDKRLKNHKYPNSNDFFKLFEEVEKDAETAYRNYLKIFGTRVIKCA